MHDWKNIIKSKFHCIVPISLNYKGEQISYGTGTVCSKNGKIITAFHVIEQVKDFEDDIQNVELLVRIEKYGVINYKPLLSGISMDIPNFANDLQLDVAIIEPIKNITTPYFITPKLDPFTIDYGENMLIAGYSEETPFVFDFDKIIGKSVPDNQLNQYKIQLGFMKPPTFKSGILSHKASLHLNGNISIKSEIYHIDNGMHSGSSGGPIINSTGEFVGIITHRAMISLKVLVEDQLIDLHTPSGNTYGIGTSVLKSFENLI